MKIIATTPRGYITEVSKDEMKILTGRDEHWSAGNHAHDSGTEVKVEDLSRHIRDMERTRSQRKSAAEALRAAATVIESTPEAFNAPEPSTEPFENPVS